MICPVCGSIGFYVKNPEDEYETFAFEIIDGEVCFPENDEENPEIREDSRLFLRTMYLERYNEPVEKIKKGES